MTLATPHTLIWVDEDGELVPKVRGQPDTEVTWAPQPGSQTAFLSCPIYEVLYEGTRGPGKTDALLMDFAQEVGKGYGAEWRGILFRQTFPELADIINKSQKWFPKIFPDANYNKSEHSWTFKDGETLIFSYMEDESDYWKYHGHAYPWIGWEELTNWESDICYRKMFSCSRSTKPQMPRKVRATCNPAGPGHHWVKARFQLPTPHGKITGNLVTTENEPDRIAIHGDLKENRILLHADPGYVQRLIASAPDDHILKAWLEGSWDIVAGTMFASVWSPEHHIVPAFPWSLVPPSWRVDRAYDHGQSKPFSVGWWLESSGEPIHYNNRVIGEVPGDLIRMDEWYGCTGKPDEGLNMTATEIAEGIKHREKSWEIRVPVRTGPADSSIFSDYSPGKSVAGDMAQEGINWLPIDKGPGSRVQGWQQIRKLLKHAIPPPTGPREYPGMFVTSRCKEFIRTVPTMPRDPKKPDDVNTKSEDHIGDETRYRCRAASLTLKQTNYYG